MKIITIGLDLAKQWFQVHGVDSGSQDARGVGRTQADRRRHRHLGHNPLGVMMVLALLAVLAAIGLPGVITLGGMLKQGPPQAFLSYLTGT